MKPQEQKFEVCKPLETIFLFPKKNKIRGIAFFGFPLSPPLNQGTVIPNPVIQSVPNPNILLVDGEKKDIDEPVPHLKDRYHEGEIAGLIFFEGLVCAAQRGL